MTKGASIKFTSYESTIPKLLQLMNLQKELKKYEKIILKVSLHPEPEKSTPAEFVEATVKFILENKNPVTSVFIAEGSDGIDTTDLFEEQGYRNLAEKYEIGLIDLNTTESEEIVNDNFLRFDSIMYPRILQESFVISLSRPREDDETTIAGSLSSMLGAFPSKHYKGFFSSTKNRIRKFPIKFSIHDIVMAKKPEFALIDSSEFGIIMAGLPLEMDKQSARIMGIDWKNVPYIKLLDESLSEIESRQIQQ